MLVQYDFDGIFDIIEPLLLDTNNGQVQRFGPGLFAVGRVVSCSKSVDVVSKGSKHWPPNRTARLWQRTGKIIHNILNNIKPETTMFWESLFLVRHRPARRFKKSSVSCVVASG